MTKDFYDLLGVDEDASKEEIRDAFREMVQEYHPDRNDDPRATAQFTAIKKAYDTLKNSSERQSYDRLGHSTYVAKRMDGMPDPGSWPSDDGEDDATSASSSTSSTARSGTTSSSATSDGTTSSSSRPSSSSSGAARGGAGKSGSGTPGHGPGSSGSGRASTRRSTGSSSRSSTTKSSGPSGSSRSGTNSSGGSKSSSRSTTSGSSGSSGSTSNAGSTGGSAAASAAGSTVGDGGTAHAGAAAGSAASGGTTSGGGAASGGTPSGGSSASGDAAGGVSGLLFDNTVANRVKSASLGWPLIFLSIALYVAGVGYYGYANRAGLTTLAGELRAAGADATALRAVLVGDRYGVTTGWEYAAGLLAGDAVGTAGGLFVAGAVLMPVVFLVVIRRTRQYYGWDPSYLYVLGVATPAVGLLATAAVATAAVGTVETVPLAAEIVCYGALPGLAVAALLWRGFAWPRIKSLGR